MLALLHTRRFAGSKTAAAAAAAAKPATSVISTAAATARKKSAAAATASAPVPATTPNPTTPPATRKMSGYNLFTLEYFKEHPGKRMADSAIHWKNLNVFDKESYNVRARDLPPREPKPVAQSPAVRQPRQKTAWDHFLAQFRTSKDALGIPPRQIMVKAGERFRKLSEAEKQKYQA